MRQALQTWPPGLRWAGFALGLVLLPLLASDGLGLSLLSQMGIAAIVCLSYWLLMGQGGMLSFGHALYSGAGAFAAIHLLRGMEAGVGVPAALLPLAAGLAAALLALPLGWLSTRHSTTAFAMITLGLGELAWAVSLMFPAVFGGESGLSGNRTAGAAPWGLHLGPALHLYYLIAAYTLASAWCIHGWTRSTAGRLLNAVRDNAERVSFIGHDPRQVRLLACVVSAFFAGLAGGLSALLHEIVTTEVLGSQRSAAVLVFTFVGGVGFLIGPLIGGVLMVLGFVVLSGWTPAWLLYLGLWFLVLVIYAPGGVAGWLMAAPGSQRPGALRAGRALSGLLALGGFAALVEMAYQLRLADTLGAERVFLGLRLDSQAPVHWLVAGSVTVMGALLWWRLRRTAAAEGGVS